MRNYCMGYMVSRKGTEVNDSIRGFYDNERKNEFIKGFLRMTFPDRESRRVWREYCVKEGYGTMETMLILLPDEGINL